MNFAFSANSRAKRILEQSANDIQRYSINSYGTTLSRIVHHIREEPLFTVALQTLENRRAEAEQSAIKRQDGVYASLPPNETDRCAILWGLVCQATQHTERGMGYAATVAMPLTGMLQDITEILGIFTTEAVIPVLNYFARGIEAGHELVALTWRYKRMVEWFRYKELASLAANNWKEQPLDEDYRRFLMESGYAFPFSQVHIPGARPDIIITDDEKTPLPIEVKVFDGEQRGIAHVRTGFGQAVDYARKYQSPYGLLLIFNVSGSGVLEFQGAGRYPHYEHQNLAVYIISVELVPQPAPSSTDGPRTTSIKPADLFDS